MFVRRGIKDIIIRTIRSEVYVSHSPRKQVSSDPANTFTAIKVPTAPLMLMSATSDTYMGFNV
jgi:hypothetical protein